MNPSVIVIGGPTASGKSALALRVARAVDGIVVNADSMQLYRDLPILTARPTAEDERAAPHALYGIWEPDIQGSAGRWLALVEPLLAQDRPLVVTGGTGLYLEALLDGIARVPAIPAGIRAEVRAMPAAALHPLLAKEDPRMASRLHPGDPQRLMRALEVVRATGRSLLDWQADPPVRLDLGPSPPPGIALMPPRQPLVARIGRRLAGMVETGGLDELDRFLADPRHLASPLMKAVGVAELALYRRGDLPLEAATEAALVATRRYAKRQMTFLRHRLSRLQPWTGFGDAPEVQRAVLAELEGRLR